MPDRDIVKVGWTTSAALLFLLAACAARQTVSPADPAGAMMVADRLFLGRAIPGGGLVSDAEWARDPQGLTVREPVMVIEVFYLHDSEADASIAEIADEYRLRFRQDAVLRMTEEARVRFFE